MLYQQEHGHCVLVCDGRVAGAVVSHGRGVLLLCGRDAFAAAGCLGLVTAVWVGWERTYMSLCCGEVDGLGGVVMMLFGHARAMAMG